MISLLAILGCSRPAIHDASRRGDVDRLSILISSEPESVNSLQDGYAPLDLANNYLIAQLLIDAGARIDTNATNDSRRISSPLAEAVFHDRIDVVWCLLKNGADPNLAVGSTKHTPLMIATINTRVECVQLLLEYGADAQIVNHEGKNAVELLEVESSDYSSGNARDKIRDRVIIELISNHEFDTQ